MNTIRNKSFSARFPQTPEEPGLSHQDRIKTVADALSGLAHCETITSIIEGDYPHSVWTTAPPQMVMQALSSLATLREKHDFDTHSPNHPLSLMALSESVLQSTINSVQVTPNLTPAEFMAPQIGEHMCLQVLGLLYTLAGRGYVYQRRDYSCQSPFVKEMFRLSCLCTKFCREAADVCDAFGWLSLEHTLFVSHVYGDTSKSRLKVTRCAPLTWLRRPALV